MSYGRQTVPTGDRPAPDQHQTTEQRRRASDQRTRDMLAALRGR